MKRFHTTEGVPFRLITVAAGLCLFLFAAAAPASAITAEEIVRKMEANQVHASSRIEGTLIITDRFGVKTTTFISHSRGEEEALIEFTSPARGGAEDPPDQRRDLPLLPGRRGGDQEFQGSALRDAVLGSDFSYEDMTGGQGAARFLRRHLEGTEILDGAPCYRILLKAKSRNVPYPQERIWVDAATFVGMRIEKYSLSGALLKEMIVLDTAVRNGRTFPVHVIMKDSMKKDSSTEFIITKIEIGVSIPDSLFSLEELSW
jgi:outer membrane lipoprotein-sorting protein